MDYATVTLHKRTSLTQTIGYVATSLAVGASVFVVLQAMRWNVAKTAVKKARCVVA